MVCCWCIFGGVVLSGTLVKQLGKSTIECVRLSRVLQIMAVPNLLSLEEAWLSQIALDTKPVSFR